MKKKLRKYYLKLRNEYPIFEKFYESYIIQSLILNSTLWERAKTIALYHSFNNEVDTSLLIKIGLQSNKTILLPKIVEKNQMIMTKVKLNSHLQYNKFGILEISGNYTNEISQEFIDLIIIPALSIDKSGYRLGYGGGYYDRYLENQNHIYKVGLIYSFAFSTQSLPRDKNDIPVDCIASIKGLTRIKK